MSETLAERRERERREAWRAGYKAALKAAAETSCPHCFAKDFQGLPIPDPPKET